MTQQYFGSQKERKSEELRALCRPEQTFTSSIRIIPCLIIYGIQKLLEHTS